MFKRFLLALLLPGILLGQVTVTTRQTKGSVLTFAEVDKNFTDLAAAANASKKKEAETLSAFDFMTSAQIADVQSGALTLDVTAALQAAIDACGNMGRILWLPHGYYSVNDAANANNYCLRITKPITIIGAGFYCAIVPKNTVGASADTIQVRPSTSLWCRISLDNFTLGWPNNGTRYGGRGVACLTIDGTTGGNQSQLPKFTMSRMNIFASTNNSYGFVHINDVVKNTNGGMYASLLENNSIQGGVQFSGSGDSNVVRNNIISGQNIGVFIDLVNGASQFSVIDNNITTLGGGIKIDNGNRFKILRNNIEQIAAGGSNAAMIDINGGAGTLVNGYIAHNHLGAFTSSGITALIRIRNSLGVKTENNTLLDGGNIKTAGAFVVGMYYRIATVGTTTWTSIGAASNTVGVIFRATGVGSGTGTADQAAFGVDIDTCASVVVGRHQWGSFAPNDGMVKIGGSAAGTIGVKIPLTPYLINSWVEYDAVNFDAPYFIKDENGRVSFGGTLKNGTGSAPTFSLAFTVPVGFRPAKAVHVSLPNGVNYGSGYMDSVGNLTPVKLIDNTNITLSAISYLAADAGGYVNSN